MLDKFGVDLTRQAREGKIDPVIGRECEIERVVQILSRRKKNNPILIGEAGVGKSAIVEGLALRIAAGDVPYTIAGKTLYSLDVSSLVAGTKFRGEFEERMQQLLDELRKADDTIIFIDEIHTIVGAGSTQGSLDTANILKPALARGELQTIGATTLDEYRENIEKRLGARTPLPARAGRTDFVRGDAPNSAQHRAPLRGAPQSPLHGRGARSVRDAHEPLYHRPLLPRQGHRRARRGGVADASANGARTGHAARNGGRAGLDLRGTPRSGPPARLRKGGRGTSAGAGAAFETGREPRRVARSLESHPAEIRAEHIAQVITSATGIPIERITTGELGRLRGLKDYLAGRVIGQDAAVEKVALSIQRSRAGLKDENRPIGVFLFVGPTGVGKTLLAKELSKWLFDERRGLIRIDMSEYGEKHNVSRLIGSPPGYVGYGEGGQLTEAVRRQPYAVVLFDEIEKAHPEVFNAMLQIFDEGHLTDGSGRKVDFRNTVIIMTSNVGSRAAVQRAVQVGYSTSSKTVVEQAAPQIEYRKALERTFAPEFLNRIDDIIVFRTLTLEDVERIVELELRRLLARTQRLGYKVEISAEAKRRLAVMGYEARYGVRSLKRTLLDNVEEPLSTLIIEGRVNEGAKVKILPRKGGRYAQSGVTPSADDVYAPKCFRVSGRFLRRRPLLFAVLDLWCFWIKPKARKKESKRIFFSIDPSGNNPAPPIVRLLQGADLPPLSPKGGAKKSARRKAAETHSASLKRAPVAGLQANRLRF